jgi:hypothetical protein
MFQSETIHKTSNNTAGGERAWSPGPRTLDYAVFVTIAAVFTLMLTSNFGYYSMDDLDMVVQPNPSGEFEVWALDDGRYLLFAALKLASAVGLDVLRDYSVLAVIYAISFALFVTTTVSYLTRGLAISPIQRNVFGLVFALAFMTHGFVGDLIAWKNCFPFMLLIFLIMAACLVLLGSERLGLSRFIGLAGLFLMLNCIYQPATMALFWLSLGRALVGNLGTYDGRSQTVMRILRHVIAVTALFIIAGIGYVALTRVVLALTGITSTRPFGLADGNTLLFNLFYHAQAVIGLLTPSGSIYGPYAGGPVVFVLAILMGVILLESALRSRPQFFSTLAILGCLTVCAQNLENLLLATYWPTGRSSFYAALLLPVLSLAAWVSIRPTMRSAVWIIVFVAISLQATMFAKLTAERFELQRRDYALAKEIGDAIRGEATLPNTNDIRLPKQVPAVHYRNLTSPVFDSGRSAFDYSFAQAPIIEFVTGMKLKRIGVASCPPNAVRDQINVRIRREGAVTVICF